MKICPRCELNPLLGGATLCEICQKEVDSLRCGVEPQTKPKRGVYFNEFFTFTDGSYEYDGRRGFRAYNSQGKLVGIVVMTDDNRTPAHKHCELHIFPKYRNHYGEWHRIISHGDRIPWDILCQVLIAKGEYRCFID